MARSETRGDLIRAGGEIIVRQGYNSTGINAVLSAAGVPKGSFYYYFANKEDFGLAVIDDFADHYAAKLDAFLADNGLTPIQRLRTYFNASIGEVATQDYSCGCLIGNLGQELASQNEAFRRRIDGVFQRWKRRFAQVLGEARDAGEIAADTDPEQLAECLLSGWEGAILRAKVTKSVKPMQTFAAVFMDRILQAR